MLDMESLSSKDGIMPHLLALKDHGMPMNLPCFFLVIDGADVDQAGFVFHYIGVQADHRLRPEAATIEPFQMIDKDDGKAYHFGFMWQSLVVTKDTGSYCGDTYILHTVGGGDLPNEENH